MLARKGESVITEDATNLLKTSLPKLDNLFNNLTKLTTKTPILSKGISQPTINIQYENLINVEGNIDKDFADEFKQMGEDISNKLKKDMSDIGKKWLR